MKSIRLNPEQVREVDTICDRFEAACKDGSEPQIEDFLDETQADLRDTLIQELLAVDIAYRARSGVGVDVDDYILRFPEQATLVETALSGMRQASTIGGTPDSPAHSEPLAEIGGYVLLEEIARGGMGIVYKAQQTNPNRLVALKLIRSGNLASAEERKRFQAEAEAAAQLDHLNIVPIYEAGEHDGRHFFSMAFIEGNSLEDVVKRHALPAMKAAKLVKVIAEAVEYAHSKGIVHRDLKPSNVLMATAPGRSGRPPRVLPKIADFGLAKRTTTDSSLTATGQVLGTPSYMPPEQAAGRTDEVGPRSDVYSLGAILYYLLTGRPPFQAAGVIETLQQVIEQEPVSPRDLNPDVDRNLETICLKCLAKDPAKRYQSASALAGDLRRYHRGLPILARPVGRVERAWRFCQRKPLVAGLLSACAVLFVASLSFGIASQWHAQQATQAAQEARTARDDATDARDDSTKKLWGSYLATARALRWSGLPGRRFDALAAIKKAAAIKPSLELRNEAIACMALADLKDDRRWDSLPEDSFPIEFAADMKTYALSDRKGNITVHRVRDDHPIARLPGSEGRAWVLRFGPRGRYLCAKHHIGTSSYPCRFHVWDVSRPAKVLEVPGGIHQNAVAFSPDGRLLAAAGHRLVRVYDLASRKVIGRLTLRAPPHSMAFHPAGRLLAVSSTSRSGVDVYNLDTERRVMSLPHDVGVRGVAWHPGGKLLATAGNDSHVHVWDVTVRSPRRPRAVLKGHLGVVSNVAFNHLGNLLASRGWDGSLLLWDPFSGERLIRVPGLQFSGSIRFRLDGQRLAGWRSGTRAGMWKVAAGAERWQVPGDKQNTVLSADMSPGGGLLAVGRDDGLRIWDVAARRQIAYLPIGQTRSAFFLADGKSIITWGTKGLCRWPVGAAKPEKDDTNSDAARGTLRIGPPERLGVSTSRLPEYGSLSADGRIIAVGDRERKVVIAFDLQQKKILLKARHPHPSRIAVSPDGRWIAAGTWGDEIDRVRVWDVRSGKKVREWKSPNGTTVAFSADSRWLLLGTPDGYRSYRVGSWESGVSIATEAGRQRMAFSRDGRLLAVCPSATSVRLIDPATQREFASLPDVRLSPLCFSHDGSQLVGRGPNNRVEVWDLRRIRQQLRALKLDWELPPYPPPKLAAATPLRMKVDLGERTPPIPPAKSPQPPVVVVRLSVPRSTATKEQIAGWITQSEEGSSEVQTKAARSLEAAGRPALAPLSKAAETAKPELKSRLEKLMQSIEVAAATAPTLVTLKFDETPLPQAVAALSKQSSIKLRLFGRELSKRRITLKLKQVPFWQALDKVCEAGRLTYSPQRLLRTSSLQLEDAPSRKPHAVAYAGICRLHLHSLLYLREGPLLDSGALRKERLVPRFALAIEPRSSVLSVGRPRFLSATDERGQSLFASQPKISNVSSRNPYLTLQPSKQRGELITHLKGVLPVKVAVGRRRALVTVHDFPNAVGKSFKAKDGTSLTIKRISRRAPVVSFHVVVTGLDRTIRTNDVSLVVADAEGRPIGSHVSLRMVGSGRMTGYVQFTRTAKNGPPATLTLSRHKAVWVELPFEFRNLRFP